MSWTVILEDENRNKISMLEGEFKIKSFDQEINSQEYILLHYLDPYGDTFFNWLQMNDLIYDLEYLSMKYSDNAQLFQIISLTKKCRNTEHSYLSFSGD
jgi:poly(3-hydroxyalkanoate) synthetase